MSSLAVVVGASRMKLITVLLTCFEKTIITCCFILKEKFDLLLTIYYQEPFVFPVSMGFLFPNINCETNFAPPEKNLIYAVTIVNWIFGEK